MKQGDIIPGFEAKKDSLSQIQSGDWKFTMKIQFDDMPNEVLNAKPGTRFLVALAIADQAEFNEDPIFENGYAKGSEPTPGQRAKRQFEAVVADEKGDFGEWFRKGHHIELNPLHPLREQVKIFLNHESANEIAADPSKWNALWTDYEYKDNL